MNHTPDWHAIENRRDADRVSRMFDEADALAAIEHLDLAAVTPACAAIRQARLTHAGVRQILETLACAMKASGEFSDIEVAGIDDTSSDF